MTTALVPSEVISDNKPIPLNPQSLGRPRIRARARRVVRHISHFAAARRDFARGVVHLCFAIAGVFMDAAEFLPNDPT